MRLQDVILRDTLANRPDATAVPAGSLYFDTTNSILYRSDGTNWASVSPAATLADGDYGDITVGSSGTTFTIDAGAVTEAKQTLADNTTNDVSTSAHGYAPKAPNDATKYLDGTGAYSVPGASSEQKTPAFVEATDTTNLWEYPGIGDGHIYVTIDGGGSAITTGVKGDLYVPFSITLKNVTLLADQSGSIVIDIWNDTIANYPPTVADSITASDKPTLSTATNSQDNNISTWTTDINGGTTLRFNVDSITTCTRVQMILGYIRRDIP